MDTYLNTLLCAFKDQIFIMDPEGYFMDFLRAEESQDNALGMQPRDFIGKHYREVIRPEALEKFDLVLNEVKFGKKQKDFEYFQGNEGYNMVISISPHEAHFGSMIFLSARKMNDRNNAHIDQREIVFRSLYEQSPEAIVIFDHHGDMLLSNPAFGEMLGYCSSWEDMDYNALVHPEDLAMEKGFLLPLIEQVSQSVEFSKRFISKWGTDVWVKVKAYSVGKESGKCDYIVGTVGSLSGTKKLGMS